MLKFSEMIFLHKGTFARRVIHAILSIALRLFFRRIEVAGAEKVPADGALIFVLNHPNGLIDPALIFVSLPRRVSFLAKSTLFKLPVVGWLIKTLEALPVYRQIDAADEMRKNFQTFDAARELLARGRCVAVFPEGLSHDETKLKPAKTGTARIALGALSLDADRNQLRENGLRIMAAGLFYTSKTTFRSDALIRFGDILEVEPVELDPKGEPPREAVLKLTAEIEAALHRATLNAENEKSLETITKAEALFSSIYETLIFKQTLNQTFLQLKKTAEKFSALEDQNPEKISTLREKVERYERDLKQSGLTLEGLSVLAHPVRYVVTRLLVRILLILLLAPLAIVGGIVHAPAYLFSNFIGVLFKTHGDDAAGSTYKVLAACLFMPVTWLIAFALIWFFFGWRAAVVGLPVLIACGYVALRVSEEIIDLTVWLRASWLLLRDRGLFLRLLLRRKKLQGEIEELIKH